MSDRIPASDRRNGEAPADAPLQQFWWLHDARWYQGVAKRFGQEAANDINAEALKFVARRVGQWYRRTHGVDFATLPMAEFVKVFNEIPATMWAPDMVQVEQIDRGENEWETVVSNNFSLRMLKIAGSLDGYECPCLQMRAGWFEGMEISVRDKRLECARTGAEACRFYAVREGDPQCTSKE